MEPIGVILAGGAGRRLGGDKAVVELAGKPLIGYPLAAMAAVFRRVAVLAKADSALPELHGIEVWVEDEKAQHPLVGILEALRRARGRPVMICAADLPFVTAALIRAIAFDSGEPTLAVVAGDRGRLQPLLARYEPDAAPALAAARADRDVPLRRAVAALEPRVFEVADPDLLFNVNAPEDLLQAASRM
jgi:molybdenum cofactor guanylyltransferase